MESRLYVAVNLGLIEEVQTLLQAHLNVNVNWAHEDNHGWTALHLAASKGDTELVKRLLAHAAINVNGQDPFGHTPLSFSCSSGRISVVQVLLEDPRVDVVLPNDDNCTPLWLASYKGHERVIEWLIASGRDLGDLSRKGRAWEDGQKYTALEIAQQYMWTVTVTLLERFMANPERTQYEVRVKLGVLDEVAAEVFALTVFVCDDLLQLKPALTSLASPSPTTVSALRFFSMTMKLPMELQMILCHRVLGSAKQNILHKNSEPAFKALARILL